MYDIDDYTYDEDAVQMSVTKGQRRRGAKPVPEPRGGDRRKRQGGVSANHLLNFSLPEREEKAVAMRKKKAPPPRTRDEFLHANYRFVIAPLASEKAANVLFDPEALTAWDNVEQVIVTNEQSEADRRCPICLDTLRAPKITRCGHTFCWSCILMYLSLSENYWWRCPMCFDSVKKTDLRSVLVDRERSMPSVNRAATFALLHRSKGSWFPHLPTTGSRSGVPSVHSDDGRFSRILEASASYLREMVEGELLDLQRLHVEAESSGERNMLPVIQEGITFCEKQLEKQGSASASVPIKTSDDDASELYTFYQLANGHTVFLHPITMRCLAKEFGDALPSSLGGKVLELEHVVMNDDARKRFRFLSHLPGLCDFYLAEIELKDTVSPETLLHFQSDLKKRARARQAKKRAEVHEERKRLDAVDARLVNLTLENEMLWPAPQPTTLVSSSSSFHASDFALDDADAFPSELSPDVPAAAYAEPAASCWVTPAVSTANMKFKKTTKKGTSLFSTSQRRNYR
ncbi:hypothetical protein SPRG_06313 [Saprolegnia parasitica CBS 223.65]|uniref:RING-type domain-containing protein n=1 Tax=Saprolegnia parasitica (strain CBS 223.65) TaxID=695850 RepID=A0A067CCR8_SAPPC|nr:hypothetical protein SPRG_06313 [Saprolegnia parasitica CBS 223.65]KDO28263.1 hypothetical protein SPRG_06313 [Saprolegnia parasitica CBS 223.65]|eukprot:XP_012201084.1 hypothetical protein SPRG_06313 [Saprolegnia parasitica CBS 223.65]